MNSMIASEHDLATLKDVNDIKIKCAEHGTKNALMAQKLDSIEKKVDSLVNFQEELLERLENKFVSKIEFQPVKSIVYGMVGFVLLAVLGAVVAYTLK